MITAHRIDDNTIKFLSNDSSELSALKNVFDEENAGQLEKPHSNLRRASLFSSMNSEKNKSGFQLTLSSDCLIVTAATWRLIATIGYKYSISIDAHTPEPDQESPHVPG